MDVKVQLRLQKIDQNHNGNGTIYCKKFVTALLLLRNVGRPENGGGEGME